MIFIFQRKLLTLPVNIAIFEHMQMAKVEMQVVTRGRIPGGVKRDVAHTLRDCYNKFGSRSPYKVEVFIGEDDATTLNFINEEKFKIGIAEKERKVSVCTHDSLRGYPRVAVSLESYNAYSKLARLGALRHEAAHTVLHGSLEFRIYKVPEDCRQIAVIKSISGEVLKQVVNNISEAIMELEATFYLIKHDFIDCQAAFALEWVEPPLENDRMFNVAATDRESLFIYKTALLRPVLLTHPLLALPKTKKISLECKVLLGRKIEELAESLGDQQQGEKLLQVANIIATNLTDDTHQNVDFAVHKAMGLA